MFEGVKEKLDKQAVEKQLSEAQAKLNKITEAENREKQRLLAIEQKKQKEIRAFELRNQMYYTNQTATFRLMRLLALFQQSGYDFKKMDSLVKECKLEKLFKKLDEEDTERELYPTFDNEGNRTN